MRCAICDCHLDPNDAVMLRGTQICQRCMDQYRTRAMDQQRTYMKFLLGFMTLPFLLPFLAIMLIAGGLMICCGVSVMMPKGNNPAAVAPTNQANQNNDDKRTDHELLQGTWVTQAADVKGKKLPAGQKEFRIVFKGDKVTFNPDQKTPIKQDFTYTLDAKLSPHALDLTATDGPNKGQKFPAIYAIEGDMLKLCLDEWQLEEGKRGKRPTAFETDEDSGRTVFTLNRLK